MSNSLYPQHARSPASHMLMDEGDFEIASLRAVVELLSEALRDSMDPKHPRPCVSCEAALRAVETMRRVVGD